MRDATGFYPRVRVDMSRTCAVGQAGGVLLTETIRASGVDVGLATGLDGWREPLATHDPTKVLLDVALMLAAVLRAEPGVFGRVASDRVPDDQHARR